MMIPRDLKKGDRLWYSKTKYAVAGRPGCDVLYGGIGQIYCTLPPKRGEGALLMIYQMNGQELMGDTPSICRIQRMDEVATEDKDVKWMLEYAEILECGGRSATAQRVRKVARRLKRYVEEHG